MLAELTLTSLLAIADGNQYDYQSAVDNLMVFVVQDDSKLLYFEYVVGESTRSMPESLCNLGSPCGSMKEFKLLHCYGFPRYC
jgi:hypothetical protein